MPVGVRAFEKRGLRKDEEARRELPLVCEKCGSGDDFRLRVVDEDRKDVEVVDSTFGVDSRPPKREDMKSAS